MPANLPPQYFEAERDFRQAKSPAEKITALEEMLAIMPKHKGTDKLRAELRQRIAKLTQAAGKKLATQRASMVIPKEGAGQVAIIGPPNSGKSQLVSTITNASPAVAEYPYTTQSATPGMMEFKNIKVQLIDTPPLSPQPTPWWLPPMLRRADALLAVIDLSKSPLEQLEILTSQLEQMRLAIGQNARVLIAANKADLDNTRPNYTALKNRYERQLPVIATSAKEGTGLEELKRKIFEVLDIIRVYTKTPGKKPDFDDPIILEKGSTLADAAAAVHKDFQARLKYARIWGSGKHDGLMVRRDHILEDEDVIELHA